MPHHLQTTVAKTAELIQESAAYRTTDAHCIPHLRELAEHLGDDWRSRLPHIRRILAILSPDFGPLTLFHSELIPEFVPPGSHPVQSTVRAHIHAIEGDTTSREEFGAHVGDLTALMHCLGDNWTTRRECISPLVAALAPRFSPLAYLTTELMPEFCHVPEPDPEPEEEPEDETESADETVTCCSCGERFDPEEDQDSGQTADGRTWCGSCCCDSVGYCERCEDSVEVDQLVTIWTSERSSGRYATSQQWCEHCASSYASCCDGCSEHYVSRRARTAQGEVYPVMMTDPSGNDICQDCYCDSVSTCEHCEEGYWTNDGPQCDCESEQEEGELADYHKDHIRRDWPDPCPTSWGMEIELDAQDREYTATVARDHDWAAEHDGSLDSHTGLELISPPFHDFYAMSESVDDLVRDLPRGCSAWRLDRPYGIHISFDTRQISKLTLTRLSILVNRDPLGLISFAAGRKPNSYVCCCPRKAGAIGPKEALAETDHTDILNIHKTRAEFRAFRSTLLKRDGRAVGPISCLQLTHALIEFCRARGPGWDHAEVCRAFFRFLESRPKDYRDLRHRLAAFARNSRIRAEYPLLMDHLPKSWARLGARQTVTTSEQ